MPFATRKTKINVTIATAVLLLGGLAACGKNETAASLVTEAKQFQAKGDNKAAVIQLKNAAVKSPEDAAVRLALGEIYNISGDPASAEKELRKAQSLGASPEQVLPQLAKALLTQRQFKKVIDETEAGLAKPSAALLAARGDAYLALAQQDKARSSYQAALAATPDQPLASIGMARLALASQDTAAANGLAQQALAKNPDNVDVLLFGASMAAAQNKADEALALYDKVLAAQPQHRGAHLDKALVMINKHDYAGAKVELDAARKNTPGNLQLGYLQALLDYTQGNNKPALDGLMQVLKVVPDHMPSLLLAGAVEFNLGTLPQAEQHLKKFLESNPHNLYARKLMVSTLMRLGRTAEAAAALEPAMRTPTQDAQLLAIAGDLALQGKDFKQAKEYLERASALDPKMASVRTSLALSKLGQGENEQAIADLEASTKLDSSSIRAGTLLVLTEMRMKRFDKALVAAKGLVAGHPKEASVHNLLGGVYLGKEDLPNARTAFNAALAQQPTFFPAVSNLAQLALRDKQPDAARKLYTDLLEKDKKNLGAMTALATIAGSQGKQAEMVEWLEKAVTENPDALTTVAQLGRLYMTRGDKQKAVSLLRKAVVSRPDDAAILDELALAQANNGDLDGALESASKVAGLAPKAPLSHYHLARIYAMKNNDAAASEALKKTLALQPDNLDAQTMMAEIAMRAKKPEQAMAIAKEIQKQRPKSAVGALLEAQLLLSEKKLAPALAAFERAYALEKAPGLLIKQHAILQQLGRGKEADQRLAQARAAYPADATLTMYAAELHLAKNEFKPAIALLEPVVKSNPKNGAALNNLAWAYQQVGDARAQASAEQAIVASGRNPALLDTLGWILVEKGDTAHGVPILKEAIGLAPGAADIRFHLGSALVKAGDKAGARKELEKLLAENKDSPKIPDVRALLKQL